MKNKKPYIRLAFMFAFIFMTGLIFNGKALSANADSTQAKVQISQQFSLRSAIEDQSVLTQGPSYSGYTRVTDNEEKINVQVPVEWSDIETGAWTYQGTEVGVFVAASSDLANFYSTRSQPGVFIGVSHSLAHTYSEDGLLGLEKSDLSRQCLHKARSDYKNQFYAGQYDQFTNCRAGTPNLLVFTTTSADQKSLILLRIVLVSDADLEAADMIMNTFQVLGDPEHDEHHDD
ncbi:MAG: hypothetical protein EHM40_05060 [Chloroflexi bacterium]|nr:MAG: hypothetical protein EHM40_05060 [Chloroflexota bacterium]